MWQFYRFSLLLVTLIKGEVFTVFLQGRLIKRVDLMSICHEIKKKIL